MKKTKVSSVDKFVKSNYPNGRVFENEDEMGIVELIVMAPDSTVWNVPISTVSILKEELFSNDELEELNKEVVKEPKENTVSEDFALKMIAIVTNKEKFSDLK